MRDPLYVPKDAELVQILLDVYEDVTGKREDPITIGGGTYCRDVEKILFPLDQCSRESRSLLMRRMNLSIWSK